LRRAGIIHFLRETGLGGGAKASWSSHPQPAWRPAGLTQAEIQPSSVALWNECRTLALEMAELRQLGVLGRRADGRLPLAKGAAPTVSPGHVHATARVDRCGGQILM